MAKLSKKFQKSRIAQKVYTLVEVENHGRNPYTNLIHTLLYKEVEIERGSVSDGSKLVNIVAEVEYSDDRYKLGIYPTMRKYLHGLHKHPLELLFYLCSKMLDNMNMARINNESDAMKFCEITKDATDSIHEDIVKGKKYKDIDLEIQKRAKRYFNRAILELIKRDAIQRSELHNYFWINPKICMRGNLALTPLEHNEFNERAWIVQKKNKNYSYRGVNIQKEGKSFAIMDGTGLVFDTKAECMYYIDTELDASSNN